MPGIRVLIQGLVRKKQNWLPKHIHLASIRVPFSDCVVSDTPIYDPSTITIMNSNSMKKSKMPAVRHGSLQYLKSNSILSML